MLETEGGADSKDHSRRYTKSGERAAVVGGCCSGHDVFPKLHEEADIPNGLSKGGRDGEIKSPVQRCIPGFV